MTMRAWIAGLAAACAVSACSDTDDLRDGFVRLSDIAPDIRQDMRYHGANNFVGRPIDGYEAAECVLAEPAARALARVQAALEGENLTLVVFDCYRPQRAVDDFVAWARDDDRSMKARFYPNVVKDRLFEDGYIAERSGHSRGATVDLALARADGGVLDDPARSCTEGWGAAETALLDFGTAFDCFDTLSHTKDPRIGSEARSNRAFLVDLMAANGFENYALEWWHFTYQPEPHPETYFDFPVR